MRDHVLPFGVGSTLTALLVGLAEFSVANLDVMMAAIGPLAFRVAPETPQIDETLLQQLYLALAVLSAMLAVWTLVRRARRKFT